MISPAAGGRIDNPVVSWVQQKAVNKQTTLSIKDVKDMKRHSLVMLMLAGIALVIMAAGLAACTGDDSSTPVDGDFESDGDTEDNALCDWDNVPKDEINQSQTKFALSMFHFNVQYVAGGLDDDEYGPFCADLCEGWGEEKVEDWIIRQTFLPVLEFYLAHPQWKVTFEMQALMLEIIADRHPDVLEKLREATRKNIVEIVSFHYSDQLFLAYPRLDMERSVAITQNLFADLCVPLSPVVFNQEGQAGEGRHTFMADHDYSIAVFPKNLFRYIHGADDQQYPRWPLYKQHGVDVVVGPGGVDPASGIETDWVFFDDGELLAPEGGMDPYFAWLVNYDPKQLDEYEAKLQEREDAGYKITSISDYVAHLKAQGVEQKEMPPVLDNTWQPSSTNSMFRWMGGVGVAPYSPQQERDNLVRSGNYRARTQVVAAEVFMEAAKADGKDVSAYTDKLDQAWRHLLLAEVSDGSGITPWAAEVKYVIRHNESATTLAGEIMDGLLTDTGWPHTELDLTARTAARIDDIPVAEAPAETTAPLAVEVDGGLRPADATWYAIGTEGNRYRVQVEIGPTDAEDQQEITIRFPPHRPQDRLCPGPVGRSSGGV